MAFVPQLHSRPSVPGDNFKSPVSGIALTHGSSITVRKSIKKTHRPKISKSQELRRNLRYLTATSNFLIRVFTSAPGAYRLEWKPAWPSPELKPSFTYSWSLFLAIWLKSRHQHGWSCLLQAGPDKVDYLFLISFFFFWRVLLYFLSFQPLLRNDISFIGALFKCCAFVNILYFLCGSHCPVFWIAIFQIFLLCDWPI